MSGISFTVVPDGLDRACGQHARELFLVAEVSVERAVRNARGGDEIVDARVVVAALDEHVAARRRAARRGHGCSASSNRPRRAVGSARTSPSRTSSAGGGAPSGACTFTWSCTPNNVRCMTSVRATSMPVARIDVRPDGPDHGRDVERVVQALEEQPEHGVEVPGWQRRRLQAGRGSASTVSSPVWRATAASSSSPSNAWKTGSYRAWISA